MCIRDSINALLAAVTWWAFHSQRPFAPMMRIGVLITTVVGLWLAIETGNSGGEIRHTEIRSGATSPAGGQTPKDLQQESTDEQD